MSIQLKLLKLFYRLLRPILFRFDSEYIHDAVTKIGAVCTRSRLIKKIFSAVFNRRDPALASRHFNTNFASPVGLSAGFDYNGYLTGIIPYLGFGFESVGTVTHSSYAGNPKPRLSRLIKSRSILVNKGFKNDGLKTVLDRIVFNTGFPTGISIGATNSPATSAATAQIADIIKSFQIINQDRRFTYFELNVSCPNVLGAGTLARPDSLETLLSQLDQLSLQKPLVVKMPIDTDWTQTKQLLDIIIQHRVAAVTIGNLATDRQNPKLNPAEVKKAGPGHFSGKPTWDLSNNLISQTYQAFGDKLTIIGVGGIFSAADAYEKIKCGASLVQLITGLIFEGPQLVAQINQDLAKLLKKDGFNNISEVVGSKYK
ncbi:MAG: quinone-dependent dihydroorotate dehydrogenase [bacterium]|nr:quinone-dependent dihydroorotate dehydrogenase [bacterium]